MTTMPSSFSSEHFGSCAGLQTRAPGDGPGTAVPDRYERRSPRPHEQDPQIFLKKEPKSMDCLEEGFEESLTILSFPRKYCTRLRSMNSHERPDEEVRGWEGPPTA